MKFQRAPARRQRAQNADSSIDGSSKLYDMMADRSRSQSVTTASQRPPSRDSTASLHSTQTQFPPTDNAHAPQSEQQQQQQQQGSEAQSVQNQYQEVPASDMAALLQGAQEFTMPQGGQNVIADFPSNSTQQHGVPNGYFPPSSQAYSHQQMPSQPHMPFANNFNALNSGRSISVPPQEGLKMEDQTKKPASATATNDRELRELLTRNRGRSLQDVASEVIATERTSKSERTKQLFAMLWLESNTQPAKTSVPRSRVYHTYASRCATERVQPLNPASFGKLVRIIFPGIATRRLGVRGESKYHYVDLCLVNDSQENPLSNRRRNMSVTSQTTKTPVIDFNTMPRLPADTAVLPTDDQYIGSPILGTTQIQPSAESRIFTDHHTPDLNSNGFTSASYEQHLAFTNMDLLRPNKNDTIDLPDIFHYAPPKTDVDAAGALVALYKTHIISLIDCVRYCKEKQFFRLFTTIQGTMTVPVHKLFVHADIAPWIRECDWLMYQKMIQCVSNLTLQVVPPVVVKFLDMVQRSLHTHISHTFHGVPHHVMEAKLEPATLFAGLLFRMLRVNQAAHAAANVLESQELRDLMWHDWVRLVNPKRIMESELPNCGYEQVYKILTHDMRFLLEPISPDPFAEAGTHYENSAESRSIDIMMIDTSVDRIASFLSSLSNRFPHTSARRMVDCISLIGTAVMREMVIGTAQSYNSWLITKVFVDEMSMWLASLGGFLEHQPPKHSESVETTPALSITEAVNGTANGSRELSRNGSIAPSLNGNGGDENTNTKIHLDNLPLDFTSSHQQQPQNVTDDLHAVAQAAQQMNVDHPQIQFDPSFSSSEVMSTLQDHKQETSQEVQQDHDMHDDSGIGMSLLDEPANKLEDLQQEHAYPPTSQPQDVSFTSLNGAVDEHTMLSLL